MILHWLDLVGTFAFAFLGARVGIAQGCNALGVVVYAALMAGGGMLCDALAHRPPRAFHDSWYTAPSALIGYTCWLMGSARSSLISLALVAGGFALQLIVEHRQYRLKLRQFTRFTGRWRPTQQLLDTEAEA